MKVIKPLSVYGVIRAITVITKFNVISGFFAIFDLTMDISHGKFISGKSGHTHRGNFPR